MEKPTNIIHFSHFILMQVLLKLKCAIPHRWPLLSIAAWLCLSFMINYLCCCFLSSSSTWIRWQQQVMWNNREMFGRKHYVSVSNVPEWMDEPSASSTDSWSPSSELTLSTHIRLMIGKNGTQLPTVSAWWLVEKNKCLKNNVKVNTYYSHQCPKRKLLLSV